MRILIAGGTGFTGTFLYKKFIANGHEVNFVSRVSGHINWSEAELTKALNNTDVLINLSGKTINCRQTTKNKQLILSSRVETTNMLGSAIKNCVTPPLVWINASASAVYDGHTELSHTEYEYVLANSFLSGVVQQWENAFFGAKPPHTRQIALRSSIILGNSGGAFPTLNKLSKLGLGGKSGNGKQYMSWIHIEDFYRLIEFVIKNTSISGIVNSTSPAPVPNKKFMKVLRNANGCILGMPAPAFAFKVLEKMADINASLILDSVKFTPAVLLNSGFNFKFPDIESAVNSLTSSK